MRLVTDCDLLSCSDLCRKAGSFRLALGIIDGQVLLLHLFNIIVPVDKARQEDHIVPASLAH